MMMLMMMKMTLLNLIAVKNMSDVKLAQWLAWTINIEVLAIVTSCRINSYHYSLSYSVWLYLAGVGLKCHVLYRCEGVSWSKTTSECGKERLHVGATRDRRCTFRGGVDGPSKVLGPLPVSGGCSDLATSSCAPSCPGASADAVRCQLFVRYGLLSSLARPRRWFANHFLK